MQLKSQMFLNNNIHQYTQVQLTYTFLNEGFDIESFLNTRVVP